MAEALARIEEIDNLRATIYEESGLKDLDEEREKLDTAVKNYALAKGDYEDERYKVTRVQGHKRWWDSEKLEKLLPKGLFLKVVDYTPNAEKIDALVKAGKIDRKKIEPAFMQKPNAPYGKITRKTEGTSGEAEADSLAAKLA